MSGSDGIVIPADLLTRHAVRFPGYTVGAIHDGTDWAIFKADAEDVAEGSAMSLADAKKTASEHGRWYDFSEATYAEYRAQEEAS